MKICPNTNTKNQSRQQKNIESSKDLRSTFKSLTYSTRKVLEFLNTCSRNMKTLRMSQQWIGEKIGYSRMTVSTALNSLEELGIINSNYRHRTTCVYEIEEYYRKPEVIRILKQTMYAFICLGLLLSRSNSTYCNSFTPFNKMNNQATDSTPISFPKSATFGEAILPHPWLYNIPLDSSIPKNSPVTPEEWDAIFNSSQVESLGAASGGDLKTQKGENEKVTVSIYKTHFQEKVMEQFTKEELELLAQYPKQAVEYARSEYTRQLAAGKTFANPFKWFVAVIQNYNKRTATQTQHPQRTKQTWDDNKSRIDQAFDDVKQRHLDKLKARRERAASMGLSDINMRTNDEIRRFLEGKAVDQEISPELIRKAEEFRKIIEGYAHDPEVLNRRQNGDRSTRDKTSHVPNSVRDKMSHTEYDVVVKIGHEYLPDLDEVLD